MIESILLSAGVFFLIMSILNYNRLFSIVEYRETLVYWKIVFIITLFFLGSYVYNLYEILFTGKSMNFIISVILLFVSLFIYLITRVSLITLSELVNKEVTLRNLNHTKAKLSKRLMLLVNKINKEKKKK